MDQNITGHQIAAGRVLVDMTQKQLAEAAKISIPTLKRMESVKGEAVALSNNVRAVRAALIEAGVLFIDQNGNGPGVRLRDRQD
ncbi:transcriptional regulator [Aminobacter niigataensis]|uniref:transcriptional regulator n=1 Tax=Aminobacter niigataensis TaxID=83265 RepID=UPI00384C0792